MARGRKRGAARMVLHILGVIVNGIVLFHAAWFFTRPNSWGGRGLELDTSRSTRWPHFIKFCHWIGQGFLFLLAGAFGMVFEFWDSTEFANWSFGKVLAQRSLLAFFYFWLGCCAIGGVHATLVQHDHPKLQFMDSTIGIEFVDLSMGFCAWFTALLNLLLSCFISKDPTAILRADNGSHLCDSYRDSIGMVDRGSMSVRSIHSYDSRAGNLRQNTRDSIPEEGGDFMDFETPVGGWNKGFS